jgi:hypothetical protein
LWGSNVTLLMPDRGSRRASQRHSRDTGLSPQNDTLILGATDFFNGGTRKVGIGTLVHRPLDVAGGDVYASPNSGSF